LTAETTYEEVQVLEPDKTVKAVPMEMDSQKKEQVR
jgi:hypothetical protein